MDIKLFRKSLAKNQGITINEALSSGTKASLKTANKHLDQTLDALDKAIDSLEDYLDDARDNKEIDSQEARETVAAINALKQLQDKLERVNDKIPAVI